MGHFGASAGGNACGTEVPRGLKPAPKSSISRGGSGVGGKGENQGSHAAVPELEGGGKIEDLTGRLRSGGEGGKRSISRGGSGVGGAKGEAERKAGAAGVGRMRPH